MTKPSFMPKWSRNGKTGGIYQLIVWWNYNCCQAGERSEITPIAFSLRCKKKKYKQVLLPFKVFYMAELFVTGKYGCVREELPGK